jgi:hypothetical protein
MRWNIGLVRDERGNGLVMCSVAWRHVISRRETAKKWQKLIRLRQLICGAIALFFLSTSYAASPSTDVVHLSSTETITGWKTDTNNFTFSDPNSTLLLGGTSVPNLSSTIPGAQLLISTDYRNAHWPFAIVGGYRNGVSGERYYSGFTPDGHFQSNMYLTLVGIGAGASESEGSMASIWADVPVALSISNAVANDAGGGLLISGWGNFTHEGAWPRVFAVSSQGTTTITNPYGEAYYTRPQFILGDIGTSSASPNWNYSSFHQHNGHLQIGSFDGAKAEGGEIDISSGQVSVAGSLILSTHTPSSSQDAGVEGTVAWDSSYLYICTSTNRWKRVPLSSW